MGMGMTGSNPADSAESNQIKSNMFNSDKEMKSNVAGPIPRDVK